MRKRGDVRMCIPIAIFADRHAVLIEQALLNDLCICSLVGQPPPVGCDQNHCRFNEPANDGYGSDQASHKGIAECTGHVVRQVCNHQSEHFFAPALPFAQPVLDESVDKGYQPQYCSEIKQRDGAVFVVFLDQFRQSVRPGHECGNGQRRRDHPVQQRSQEALSRRRFGIFVFSRI